MKHTFIFLRHVGIGMGFGGLFASTVITQNPMGIIATVFLGVAMAINVLEPAWNR